VSTALVLSGLPVDRFAFVGFLARTKGKLVEQVAAFDGTGAAVAAFESPRRVRASVAALGERWPGRQMAVCRELTKVYEEVVRGTAAEVLERLADPARGEIVLVLEPAEANAADTDTAAERALTELIESGVGVKRAAGVVAELTGLARRELYEVGLQLKRRLQDSE
jgi:16S rRNA (cytidine1402-2'-O)-methyltransferase